MRRGGADDRRSIAAWVAAWGDEVDAADIAAGRRRFADDLLAFGTHADVVEGRDVVEEQQWSQVWPAIEDFTFQVASLRTIVSADRLTSVAIVRWDSTGIGEDGSRFDRPGRATIVLERGSLSDDWVGVHTHFSLERGVPEHTFGRRPAIR